MERLAFRQPGRRKELAVIVDCYFGLDLTYENYWYQRAMAEYEVPDSASSAESYVESISGLSAPKPGKKALSVASSQPKSQSSSELKQQAAKVQELSLAVRMKEEELKSLQRLSLQFAHFSSYLLHSIERKRNSAEAETAGFEDQVRWEDPDP